MENVERGQTVEPFEKRRLLCEWQGEFSDPVVSQFGVHLIQLLERHQSRG